MTRQRKREEEEAKTDMGGQREGQSDSLGCALLSANHLHEY